MNQKGFTLIELLVVVAIIGIMASIVLAALGEARGHARDAQRLSDMREIRKALELFYNEHKRYPGNLDGIHTNGEFIGVGDDIDDVLGRYIQPIPRDPLHDGTVYFYSYDSWHYVEPDCSNNDPSTWGAGIVWGFNRAEQMTSLPKETCKGGHMNLNNADYNQAVTR